MLDYVRPIGMRLNGVTTAMSDFIFLSSERAPDLTTAPNVVLHLAVAVAGADVHLG